MKIFPLFLILNFCSCILFAQEKGETDEFQLYNKNNVKVSPASKEAVENWKDQRFGMFIHWGPISQLGKQLSHSRNSSSHHPGGKPYKVADIEPEVYDIQYKTFNPEKYDPDAIVQLAKNAGMSYVVFTAKHHAGFSMFDSKVTGYDIMSAPYGKDILKELEQACRRNNFNFGFYYSPRDWRHPDCDSEKHHGRYIKFYKAQMDELLKNYGPVFSIFFDGLGPGDWGNTSTEVMQRIRTLQPDAIVNDRGGAGADYYTPEHTVSYYNSRQNWEACHTTTGQWGYNPETGPKPFSQLMEILLYTWGADGNVLLNIGPRGDGSLNPVEVERLEQIGSWWSKYGETSIRKSRGGPYLPGAWGVSTRKENKIYLHVFRWPEDNRLLVPQLPGLELQSAGLLNKKHMKIDESNSSYIIHTKKKDRDSICTTIEMVFSDNVIEAEPVLLQKSLLLDADLTASQNPDELWKITDQNAMTFWEASSSVGEEIWIEATFDKPTTIGSVVTARGDEWHPRHSPKLQVQNHQGEWETIFSWKPKWEPVKFLDKPITTRKIRLKIDGTTKYYIAEFELYPPFSYK